MRIRNNDFTMLRIKRPPYLFAGYHKVLRCKLCGKIYPEYVPNICRRCGKELTEEMNPEEVIISRPQYTDLVEKVVAKKGLFGWRVLRTDDTERSAD